MSILDDLKKAKGLYVRCPNPDCEKTFALKQAKLFDATKQAPDYAKAYISSQRAGLKESLAQLKRDKAELNRSSFTAAESGGVGQIVQMLSPSLPGFPLAPQDCRAIFEPIDYVGFKGLTVSGRVDALVFVEVKSGRQPLSGEQRQIKSVVEDGKIQLITADHRIVVK